MLSVEINYGLGSHKPVTPEFQAGLKAQVLTSSSCGVGLRFRQNCHLTQNSCAPKSIVTHGCQVSTLLLVPAPPPYISHFLAMKARQHGGSIQLTYSMLCDQDVWISSNRDSSARSGR